MKLSLPCAVTLVLSLACCGCPPKSGSNGKTPNDGSTPPNGSPLEYSDINLESTLPQFTKHPNEVEIAASFNEIDPTNVLGSLVNLKNSEVRSLDNCLKEDAKPKITPQTEIVFKRFIENSVAAEAEWLDFVTAEVGDKVRAEVCVTKTARVTVDNSSLDGQKIEKLPKEGRDEYGVIIGYIDFVLSASLFTDRGAEGTVSGYGAKIGGKWYSKTEDTQAYHRLIAIWSPLPFIEDRITKSPAKLDLGVVTAEAMKSGDLSISPLRTIIRHKFDMK